jgi:hypothetical protein
MELERACECVRELMRVVESNERDLIDWEYA